MVVSTFSFFLCSLAPYWANTGENSTLAKLIQKGGLEIKSKIEQLINNQPIEIKINEELSYKDLMTANENILNMFLLTGYVTVVDKYMKDKKIYATVRVPNIEVESELSTCIDRWFQATESYELLESFKRAILNNDKEFLQSLLNQIMDRSISYFDYAENFYHGLILGMLVMFGEDFYVTSNRESGRGRSDVMVYKKDNSFGAVFEFKVAKDTDNLEEMATVALSQIEDKEYYKELEGKGVQNILKFGAAFTNKDCFLV